VLPRTRKDLETSLRKLTPAVLYNHMKTNTAANPVMDSHPQENFSADLSVFQAHLPWQFIYI